MNVKTVVTTAVLAGVLLGAALAYRNVGDPGSDMSILEPRPFSQAEPASSDSLDPAATAPSSPSATSDSDGRLAIEVVDGEEFDFGVMDEGEKRSHEFVFQNHSDQAVKLEVKETTCKCTVGELPEDTMTPGGEVTVKLEWKPIALQRDFRQSATITTTCEDRPQIVLSVFGQVMQSLLATPSDIAFSDVSFRSGRESSLVIHAFKDPDFKITGHSWVDLDTAEFFEFTPAEVTDEHRAAEKDAVAIAAGLVRLKSGLPLGPFQQMLQLDTNVERFGVLEIPIHGRIVGDVSFSGSKFIESRNLLKLGPVGQAKGATMKILMTVKGPHADGFEIKDTTSTPELLKVEVEETRTLKNGALTLVKLKVTVPPGSPPVNYSGGNEHELGKVVLSTTHPELAEIPFSVQFAITE